MRSIYYFTMYLCYVSKLFILFPMCQNFLLYFTILFCILCFHAFTLFHHISMFMFPSYLHYFTILICYVSKLFILFLMCQNFLLYFTISIVYVYVSTFSYYFTVHIQSCALCFHTLCYFTIHVYVYVSKLFILFLMCQNFLLCFTILYVFMFPCFCTISPYILIIYVMYPYYSHYFTT